MPNALKASHYYRRVVMLRERLFEYGLSRENFLDLLTVFLLLKHQEPVTWRQCRTLGRVPAIQLAIQAVARRRGLFRGVACNLRPLSLLQELVEHVQEEWAIGRSCAWTYECLLADVAAWPSRDSVHHTRRPVGEAVAASLRLTATDSVLDITCGTGSLLLAAAEANRPAQPATLQGIEIAPRFARMASARLLLHSWDGAAIVCADALAWSPSTSFDVGIGSLPVGRTSAQLAFIERTRAFLKPGGRAALVTTNAAATVVYKDAACREQRLPECEVYKVASLSPRMLSGHNVPGALLYFRVSERAIRQTEFAADNYGRRRRHGNTGFG